MGPNDSTPLTVDPAVTLISLSTCNQKLWPPMTERGHPLTVVPAVTLISLSTCKYRSPSERHLQEDIGIRYRIPL
ncbi:hypothetical protein CEXT_597841 [Caerostris extrusa]|uniref:Uncharacterized protein n=1 Tax=Caerostris extrusa TaxID=172846 RepID=A0AAV4UC64_CAEEX|nr:hypothetical protein CEXT_597841 [Caerostris extrusa]